MNKQEQIEYIVSYSGGIGSFLAAERLKRENPMSTIRLVFCDTKIEDEDLYRFLEESAKALDLELIKIEDGRNPWELFTDIGYQGNSRIAPCSSQLKRRVFDTWLADNYPDRDCIIVMGVDWQEQERLERAQKNNPKFKVIAPLCDKPWLNESDKLDILKHYDLKRPRLYDLGFPHNNCGGFCVRAGLGQFKLLQKHFPERFQWHKEQQNKLVETRPEANKPFLRKVVKGELNYLTLEEFENQELSKNEQLEFMGCGCFVDDEVFVDEN